MVMQVVKGEEGGQAASRARMVAAGEAFANTYHTMDGNLRRLLGQDRRQLIGLRVSNAGGRGTGTVQRRMQEYVHKV